MGNAGLSLCAAALTMNAEFFQAGDYYDPMPIALNELMFFCQLLAAKNATFVLRLIDRSAYRPLP